MFWLSKAAIPHMRPGASIINAASIEACQPEPGLLDYASTKGAIVTFTKGLAQDLIAQGIRVNAVAPGPVWTPLIPATMPAEQVTQFGASESPIGRPAQPAELAPPYVFLASQESSYVSGQVLGVTGGAPQSQTVSCKRASACGKQGRRPPKRAPAFSVRFRARLCEPRWRRR